VFSWIVHKSRKDRDKVNAQVMKDPRLVPMMDPKTCFSTASACSGVASRPSSSSGPALFNWVLLGGDNQQVQQSTNAIPDDEARLTTASSIRPIFDPRTSS
jgi:hypothetical protein